MSADTESAAAASVKTGANGRANSGLHVALRWDLRLAVGALIALTSVAYAPGLRAPFQFDDVDSIATNPTIRRLWPPSIPLNPPKGIAVSGRPVVNYSLALNVALNEALGVDQRPDPGGPNKTLGFHVGNLALHLGCGLLLFGILRRTLLSARLTERWSASANSIATVVAAVWLIHPIQAEAVNYLTQRTELLVSLFYLLTLYAAIRAWDAPTRHAQIRWYATSVTACLLGMGSKEVMITAPLLIYTYDTLFRTSSRHHEASTKRDRRIFYALLWSTTIVALAATFTGARADTVGFRLGIPWYQYLYSQAWAIAQYMRLTILPSQLVADYGTTPIAGPHGIPGLVLLTCLGVATCVALVRKYPVAFLGASFFLILAPSSSVVPISTEIAAERRFYLPLARLVTCWFAWAMRHPRYRISNA